MTSRTTVLAVVVGLALFALLALAGCVWLIHDGVKGDQVAIIATPMGVALGALGSVLASTRSTIGASEREPSTLQAAVTPVVVPASPQPSRPGDPGATERREGPAPALAGKLPV